MKFPLKSYDVSFSFRILTERLCYEKATRKTGIQRFRKTIYKGTATSNNKINDINII